jgi:MerR family transcriptional regulator, redox-sensitive transcriptional activator SoxR
MDAALTIGQLAERVGVNTSAIRYYERISLLPEPDREHGQRRYDEATIRRLQVIDIAKRAGFTLDDARVLLATGDGAAPAHEPIRDLARRKLPEVEALIAQAEAMRAWLLTAGGCNCETLDVCALFEEGAAPRADARPTAVEELRLTHVG